MRADMPSSDEPANLAAALALARQGLFVFPVQSEGEDAKKPFRFFPWKEKSTCDEEAIRAFWRQYPTAMPAIDVGKSGRLVIDADRHDAEHDGVEAWAQIMAAHGFDPAGLPIVATPNEGCHFIFREPQRRFGNGKGSLPKGVDVRGAGGYIVAPGAIMADGRFYELAGDLSAEVETPDWLAELLARKGAEARAERQDPPAATSSFSWSPRPVESTETSLDEIADLLGHISPDVGYDEWLQALMALHAATVGSAAGLSLADDWSSGGRKYRKGEVAAKWRSFKSGGVNGATLAALAQQHGADLSEVRKRHMPQPDAETVAIGERAAAAMYRPTSQWIEHPDGTITDRDGVLMEDTIPIAAKAPAAEIAFPPGLVGDIARYICSTARRPQPMLALAAALVIVGTVAGRQFAGPTRSALHLYALGLAPTGQGKDHALQQIARIMTAAQLGQHLGPSEFISMPAVSNFVTRAPLSVCAMDEFGDFLARILHKRASSFERSVAKLLRSFWGISFGVYQSPEWAGRSSVTIHCPAMSIYGASTPEQFWRALEGSALEDGTLNRFLLVEGAADVADRDPEIDSLEVPAMIVEGIRWIFERSGPLAQTWRNQPDVDIAPKAIRLGWADEAAERVYLDLLRRTEKRLKDPDQAPFFARTAEMAVRIATIAAIGRLSPERVSAEDMRFGAAMAEASGELMLEGARDYLSDTESQANAQKIRRIIKAHGGKIQRRGLLRAMRYSVKARELTELLDSMAETGELSWKDIPPVAGGPPARWYFMSPS